MKVPYRVLTPFPRGVIAPVEPGGSRCEVVVREADRVFMKTAQAIPSLKHLKPQAPKRRPAGAKASGGRSLLFGVSLKFGLWCFGVLIWSLSASSQEITLSIAPAVHVTWPTTSNEAYQVEVSTNLPGNWTPIGDQLPGR